MIGAVSIGGAALLICVWWVVVRFQRGSRDRAHLAGQISELAAHNQALEENTSQPIVGFESRGLIRSVNRAAEELLGYSAEELLGQTIAKLVQDPSFISQQHETIEIRRKDGSRVRLPFKAAKLDKGRPSFIYLFLDPNPPKVAALALTTAAGAAASATLPPLPYAARIVGRIAGQYESLLTTINGYSEFALIEIAENNPLRHELQEILAASDRASSLTRHLVAFSGAQFIPMEPVDLNCLVAGMREQLYQEFEFGIDFDLAPMDRTPLANADCLRQIIVMLCGSARGRMRESDRLRVGTAQLDLTDRRPVLSGEIEAGTYGVLSISDSGRPLNARTLEHLFEPLYPVHQDLGVEISPIYGIVQSLGGGIDVISGERMGTRFEILLPCAS